ncbi:MAG: sugar transferase [Alphaproteobacteria bacterium]|nr:sugar transferase [Alphaproteobacteria bacterium]
MVGFRVFDITISIIALILSAPIMMAIALVIKFTSKGPVIYTQQRYGLNQKKFTIYKFRSMVVSKDNQAFLQCAKNDARVTFAGRLLRKSSLDELPQFLNVLRGEMAIVGPRPHAVEMDDEYMKSIANYAKRFAVKPGITGLAQIRGFRGATDTLDKIVGRIKADCEYIERKTIFLDIYIICLTFPALVKPQNARWIGRYHVRASTFNQRQ